MGAVEGEIIVDGIIGGCHHHLVDALDTVGTV